MYATRFRFNLHQLAPDLCLKVPVQQLMRHTTIAVGKANKWPAAYAASVLVSVAAGHKGHDQAILETRLMTVLQRGIDQMAAEQESQA